MAHIVTASFKALGYPEFDKFYTKLCKAAGGGIKNFYTFKQNNMYEVLFYYPSIKASNAGMVRMLKLAEDIKELQVNLA